jgi:hypothetical protein
MAARLSASFGVLGCAKFGLTNPASLTLDGNGVATAATYNLAEQAATMAGAGAGGGTASPSPSPTASVPTNPRGAWGHRHRHRQAVTGM